MLTCREATRLVSDSLERSLPRWTRWRLGIHLLLCHPCTQFRRVVCWLDHSLALSFRAVRLSPRARERIRRALAQASQNE